jgi:acyl-CoA dehydrogenase
MHQIQLQCLARHGLGVPFFDAYLRELAQTQALVASATSELGIGGALRRSGVAIEADGSRFQLFKRCPAISYCKQADAILVSARRSPGAEAGDQVLALLRTSDCELQVGHDWDSLGLRGTCTPSVDLRGSGAMEQILPAPLAVISSMTLVPFAHVSWASGWLGLAQDAAAIARHTVSSGGSSEVGARALAEAHRDLHALQAIVSEGIRELESLYGSAERDGMLFSLDFIRASNDLKVLAADLTSRVCQGSLRASGLRGYTNNSTGSLGRHVRDALGAVVMIANERLLAANTQFLLTPPQD